MKARFFFFQAYGSDEMREFIEIDPEDNGRNKVAREANDSDRARWRKEYETFEKNKDAEKKKGAQTAQAAAQTLLAPSVRAAIPMGQEDAVLQAAAQAAGAATPPPPPTTQTVGTMQVQNMTVAPEGQSGQAGPNAQQPGTQQTASTLTDMNATDAIARIKSTTDHATLERYYDAESSGPNRKTVLDAIDAQLEKA